MPQLDDGARKHLGHQADLAIRFIEGQWAAMRKRPKTKATEAHALAWMESGPYLALAEKSMQKLVIDRFLERGISVAGRTAA